MFRMKSTFALSFLAVLLCVFCVQPGRLSAQLPPPETQPIHGARMPALNPDGQRLAFLDGKCDIPEHWCRAKTLLPDIDADHAVLQRRARRSAGCRTTASNTSITAMKDSA